MIEVSLRYYNIVADLLGQREEQRVLPPGTTLRGLIQALGAESPSFRGLALADDKRPGEHLRVFRNGQVVVDLDSVLADGDEIRLFPTISGG
jgi:molybdopterin converting factor small subunit